MACAIGDLRFDFGCLCVAERILQRFPCDAVNVVAKDWMQLPRCTLHRNAERCWAAFAISGAAALFTQRCHSLAQFVGYGGGGTQSLNGIATPNAGLVSTIDI